MVQGALRRADGKISAEYEYGPFGEMIRASGPAKSNPIRFSTKYTDDETDLADVRESRDRIDEVVEAHPGDEPPHREHDLVDGIEPQCDPRLVASIRGEDGRVDGAAYERRPLRRGRRAVSQ